MADELTRERLLGLARIGAQVRIQELNAEIQAITAQFPDLGSLGITKRDRKPGRRPARPPKAHTSPATTAAPRKRRKLSPAQRRAISERMTKRWAAFRAERAVKKKK